MVQDLDARVRFMDQDLETWVMGLEDRIMALEARVALLTEALRVIERILNMTPAVARR